MTLITTAQTADASVSNGRVLIEYDPQPPFDAGSLAKADAATKARADEFRRARQ